MTVGLPPRHPLSPQKARALARAGALREAEPDGRELLDRMDRGEPVMYPGQFDASGFATSNDVAKPEVLGSSTPVRGQTHKTARWTRDAVIGAIQAYAAEHGYPPSSHDWRTASDEHPNSSWVKKLFGSWADAVVAAGFERPRRGGSRKLRRKRTTAAASSEREAGASEARRASPDGVRPSASGSEALTRSEDADDFPDETKDAYATALIAAARAFADTLEEELALL